MKRAGLWFFACVASFSVWKALALYLMRAGWASAINAPLLDLSILPLWVFGFYSLFQFGAAVKARFKGQGQDV